ncbi:hypothetical protein AURDEDRAFT_72067, partial [Auricularia subglabra TFB-10046 SS5]
RGPSRLLRILTSEAAFLIWKIRNERRIKNKDDPEKHAVETEITNRFRSTIERRFRVDVNMTSKKSYKGKALKWKTMAQTWELVLYRSHGEPRPLSWCAGPELLVGIWPPRPRGRER